MLCCLNPDCPNPENPDGISYCQSCGTQLIPLLRGHYRVIKLLSDEGGFGRTYLAEDADKLNESCVVKQLAPKTQQITVLNKAVELFEEEAKRLQELGKHPHIPTLLAYFQQDNYLYLVQEFIDGQNLLQELQQRLTYSETEIRELLLDLLPVLKFIHERGVIHRDIKLQNIMRRSPGPTGENSVGGDLVLIDFGASKQLSATVRTKPGTIIGTFGYSPLEQMQNGEAYPASDLFSLGATWFHLLTGVSPHQLWSEQGYGWVGFWQQYLRNPISTDLAEVLDKLLKKDFQQRYQSADEVIQDLKPPPPPPQPRQNPKLRQGLLVGGVILLLGVGVGWYVTGRTPVVTEESSLLVKTLKGHSNLVTSVAISAIALSNEGLGGILVSGSFDTTLKRWNLSTGKEISTLEGNAGSVHAVAISSDGRTIASGHGNNTIKLWNLSTGQEIGILKGHSSSVESVAISQDSKILAGGGFDGTIKLWDLATKREIATFKGNSTAVKSVAFAPDGQTLASGSNDNTILLWNLASKQVIQSLKGHSQGVRSVAFSPIPNKGGILASGSTDKTIKLWNPTTKQEINTLNGHSYSVNSVTFSPDGKILASGSADNTIKLWNVATQREIRTLKGHSKEVTSVAFSPDGKTLASGSADNSIKIWQVSP